MNSKTEGDIALMARTVAPIRNYALLTQMASWMALAALFLLLILAALGSSQPTGPDKIVNGLMSVVLLTCFWTGLQKSLLPYPSRCAFALACVFFIVYGMARRVGPDEGWALRFAALPDDSFPISYAARIAFAGAILSIPSWTRIRNGWLLSMGVAVILVGLFAALSFRLLGANYPVGVTEIVDPTPLIFTGMQLTEYLCVAAICASVATDEITRRLALKVLPFLLAVVTLIAAAQSGVRDGGEE